MKITQRKINERITVIDLDGDFDLYSSPKAREILLDLAKKQVPMVIINLDRVEYMDSSGIATLIEYLRRVGDYGGKLKLVSLNKKTMEVIRLARLETIFDICKDEQEAMNELEAS